MLFVNSYRPNTQSILRPETNATVARAQGIFKPSTSVETNATVASGSTAGSSCGSSSSGFSAVA